MNTLKRATLVTVVAGCGLILGTTAAAAHSVEIGGSTVPVVTEKTGDQGQSGELDRASQSGDQGDKQDAQTGDQGAQQEGQSGDQTQSGEATKANDGDNEQSGPQGQSGDHQGE